MKTLGICTGASTISAVGLIKEHGNYKEIIQKTIYHDGDAKGAIEVLLNEVDPEGYDRIVVTGRKFRNLMNLTSISEPEAVEDALEVLISAKDRKEYNALVSSGGETILAYELDENGKIKNVYTGNKCASGTGEFFLQQLNRMGLEVDDIQGMPYSEEVAYDISGRCSVFCKSDCTHALNKGIQKDRVVLGLCKVMAFKITELLTSLKKKNIILTGGISKIKPITGLVEMSVDKLLILKESFYFEAYGAAIWAFRNETQEFPGFDKLFKNEVVSFRFLKPIKEAENLVEFKSIKMGEASDGDECIIGVDIGSTTTKAVLIRKKDDVILASVYLRTLGDPTGAAINCYREIYKKVKNKKIRIVGLGTTGSGRYITGLHAMTDSIYNEIICHATASIYFDKDVDTIFEIGGQDAKYIYITQGVPSDYAMNEACSAGTGSFLEETIMESLNIPADMIADIALKSENPPNFNDQCSAFMSSDIATAFQEGIPKNDIVAGIVYSICINYNNRVRGPRPYGKKIFMQGGVCYNKAVPIAMAALLNTKIIVPAEPGLMGAFGCAYEIKKRLDKKMLEAKDYKLEELINRKILYGKSFYCKGGVERCDRKCKISIIEVEGQKIPYGGACNKYYNILIKKEIETTKLDLVALREKMLFEEFAKPSGRADENSKAIGLNRTFLVNMLYPLYFHFWDQLGYRVVLSDGVTMKGREKNRAAFCFPAEIAHGAFDNLLSKNVDYIFMPHIMHIPVIGNVENNKACVFVQGEPYYLKEAFKDRKIPTMLVPIIDFQQHSNTAREEFIKVAKSIGIKRSDARKAYDYANNALMEYFKAAWAIGKEAIEELEKNPDDFAIVLMGRWYNALAKEANMAIPHKIASSGYKVIPYDFIPYDTVDLGLYMHWGVGKIGLQVAKYVKKHPQLFATYVTNFSCGPDSFVVPYIRDVFGDKPSLTLELDSHSADVGLNTRIEAAIDVIRHYRQLPAENTEDEKTDFVPSETINKGTKVFFKDSRGKIWDFKNKNVTFLFPVMGKFLTEGGIAVLKREGFNAKMVENPDITTLTVGKANSSCKECLPYVILVGSMLGYIKNHKREDEKVGFFIVGDPAPCRVEQYQVGLRKLIEKNKIRDVAVHTLDSTEGFAGMGLKPMLQVWKTFVLADIMEQIYSVVISLADNKELALEILNGEWHKIVKNLEGKENGVSLYKRLEMTVDMLDTIKIIKPVDEAHRVTVTGEMYVRNEMFARLHIEETLAKLGFIVKITPLIEWIYYVDYVQWKNYGNEKFLTLQKRLFFLVKRKIQSSIEKKIKKIFGKTHLYEYDPIDIQMVIATANPIVHPKLLGDIGLTVSGGLKESLSESCGVISLGPFACMQTRVAESLLKMNMTVAGKLKVNSDSVFGEDIKKLDPCMPLPYLAIESDGNPYPQIIEAQLEVFALQAHRVGDMMNEAKKRKNKML